MTVLFLSYPCVHSKDVAVVALGLYVFGNVCEVTEVIPILTCTMDIANLMLAYHFLLRGEKYSCMSVLTCEHITRRTLLQHRLVT